MKLLSRYDFEARFDRAMRATVLRYAGRGIVFEETLYGHDPGVVLALVHDELSWPPSVQKVSDETGVPIPSTSGAAELQRAIVDALVAQAMVEMPQLLTAFSPTETRWIAGDVADLTRRHALAMSRVAAHSRIVETELKLRAPRVAPTIAPMPSVATMPMPYTRYAPCPPAPAPSASAVPTPAPGVLAPATSTVTRAQEAVDAARAAELSQRLPQGVRRALERMVRSVYLVRDGDPVPVVRADLVEAMTDGERMARDEKVDVTVIDWDGEWPVVARRYEKGGRTIYRVEDALKRQERAA